MHSVQFQLTLASDRLARSLRSASFVRVLSDSLAARVKVVFAVVVFFRLFLWRIFHYLYINSQNEEDGHTST